MSRQRITRSMLESAANLLNRIAGTPEAPYRQDETGRYVANVGTFHISSAYGGYSLHQMVSEGGAIRDVLHSGHIPARELLGKMHAFRYGMEEAASSDA